METRGDTSTDEAKGMWLEEWTAGSTASNTSNTGDGLGLPGGAPPTAVWTPEHMLGFPSATRTRTATPSPAVALHMTWDDEESTTRIWTDAEYAMSASMLGRLGLPPIDEDETPARRAIPPARPRYDDAAGRARQAMHEKAKLASSRAAQPTLRSAPARQPAPPPARRHAKTLLGMAGPQPTPMSRPAPTWQPAPPAAANPTLRARPRHAPAPAQQLRPAPTPRFSTAARPRPAPRSSGLQYWVRCLIAGVALFAGVLLARLLLPDIDAPTPKLRGTTDIASAPVIPPPAPVSVGSTVAQPAPAPTLPTPTLPAPTLSAPTLSAPAPVVAPHETARVTAAPTVKSPAKPARSWHSHRRTQAHAARAAAEPAERKTASKPSKQAAEPSTPPPAAQEKARPASAGFGTLRINSRPWAQVYVDGKMLGTTPQMNLIVPAGHHTIELINPPMEMSKKFSVEVAADEVVTKILNLIE